MTGPVLSSATINTVGPRVFSTPNLIAAIQDMVTTGDDDDGFLLRGPGRRSRSVSTAIQIGEQRESRRRRRHAALAGRGRTPAVLGSKATSSPASSRSSAKARISAGFTISITTTSSKNPTSAASAKRWRPEFIIHALHLHLDRIASGYTGVDCCTWQIDSPQTGTVGTGHALFFHNLDAGNPANLPPDSTATRSATTATTASRSPTDRRKAPVSSARPRRSPSRGCECGPGGDCGLAGGLRWRFRGRRLRSARAWRRRRPRGRARSALGPRAQEPHLQPQPKRAAFDKTDADLGAVAACSRAKHPRAAGRIDPRRDARRTAGAIAAAVLSAAQVVRDGSLGARGFGVSVDQVAGPGGGIDYPIRESDGERVGGRNLFHSFSIASIFVQRTR
ncbi:MAG: hypothetical protein R3F21_09005 [Myxococcota bacterium]